jgi:hypothetical protein
VPHPICLHHLEFATVAIRQWDSDGYPSIKLQRVGMPKIPPEVLDCTFYLYNTKEDARAGINPQGTGFIIAKPSAAMDGEYHYYGVTNWHIAVRNDDEEGIIPSPVVRLNKRGGQEPYIKDLKPEDWHYDPNGPDIVIAYFDFLETDDLKWNPVSTGLFAGIEEIKAGDVAVGDDTFMLGLFVDHDAVTTNIPSARFGNISQLPSPLAKIQQKNGFMGECYIVDMHSRTGFSGSPVFMSRTLGQDLSKSIELQLSVTPPPIAASPRIIVKTIFVFLGIHVGQFPEEWEAGISKAEMSDGKKRGLVMECDYASIRIQGVSGMTIVIPAWYITRAIDELPGLVPMREIREKKLRLKKRTAMVSEKVAPFEKAHHNPNHKEDFTALLSAAARKREPKD